MKSNSHWGECPHRENYLGDNFRLGLGLSEALFTGLKINRPENLTVTSS